MKNKHQKFHMTKILKIYIFLFLFLLYCGVATQNVSAMIDNLSLQIHGGYRLATSNITNGSIAFDAAFSTEIVPNFLLISGIGAFIESDITDASTYKIPFGILYKVGTEYQLRDWGAVYPFANIGLGGTLFREFTYGAELGGGIGYELSTQQSLRLMGNVHFSDQNIYMLSIGFSTDTGPKITAIPPPDDSDADGIPDFLDQCPNSPTYAIVDTNGCTKDTDLDGIADYLDQCPYTPYEAVINEYGCPEDSDYDGIPDYLDHCPYSLFGVEVSKTGCAKDTDKDGIPDYQDSCPRTIPGGIVDTKGCLISVSLDIRFKTESDIVEQSFHQQIYSLATFLKKNPKLHVEIQGHTDDLGSLKLNRELSEKRAIAVKSILTNKFKLSAKRIHPIGLAYFSPILENVSSEARSINRRVEAHIIYTP